jgi:hypothetical protein
VQHVADVPGLPPGARDGMSGVGDLESREPLDVGVDDVGEPA